MQINQVSFASIGSEGCSDLLPNRVWVAEPPSESGWELVGSPAALGRVSPISRARAVFQSVRWSRARERAWAARRAGRSRMKVTQS